MSTALASPVHLHSLVNGELVDGDGRLESDVNPAHPEEAVATYRILGPEGVEAAIDSADAARGTWRSTPIHQRAAVLHRASEWLAERTEHLGAELSREQGKALGEVGGSVDVLRYFAQEANRAAGSLYASPRPKEGVFTTRVPVGTTGVITPWNVPLAIPTWKIAPALVHGNTVVWKPAEETPLISARLAEALHVSGLPPGALNMVLSKPSSGELLATDSRIRAVSFTGSTRVGKHLIALGAQHGTRVLAEMGARTRRSCLPTPIWTLRSPRSSRAP